MFNTVMTTTVAQVKRTTGKSAKRLQLNISAFFVLQSLTKQLGI